MLIEDKVRTIFAIKFAVICLKVLHTIVTITTITTVHVQDTYRTLQYTYRILKLIYDNSTFMASNNCTYMCIIEQNVIHSSKILDLFSVK